MKRTYNLLLVMVIGTITFAQVPNSGFENWTGTEPDNWLSNNIESSDLFPVTQSSDAHSGASAIRGDLLENPFIDDEVYPPFIQTNGGIPVSQDPSTVTGWYKFSPIQASAILSISCTTVDSDGQPTGVGTLQIMDASSNYSSFSMPINYFIGSSEPTAIVNITFSISDQSNPSSIGSWFLIDDVMLDGVTEIFENEFSNAEMGAPYPIPFREKVTIPVTLETSSFFKVEVIDQLARPVEILNNDILGQGSHLLDWTPSELVSNGVYFIRISNREGFATRRVLLER